MVERRLGLDQRAHDVHMSQMRGGDKRRQSWGDVFDNAGAVLAAHLIEDDDAEGRHSQEGGQGSCHKRRCGTEAQLSRSPRKRRADSAGVAQ